MSVRSCRSLVVLVVLLSVVSCSGEGGGEETRLSLTPTEPHPHADTPAKPHQLLPTRHE